MLGFEVSPVVQYVIAFAIIAALLGLFAVVLKRIGGRRFALAGQDRGRARQPRLGIVDVYDLDRQRQLVLLRRDNVEHLVMLGGPNDLVVETNIVRVATGRAAAPASSVTTDFTPERGPQAELSFEPAQAAPVAAPRPSLEPALAAAAGLATPPVRAPAAMSAPPESPRSDARADRADFVAAAPAPASPPEAAQPRPAPAPQPPAPQPPAPRSPALQAQAPQPPIPQAPPARRPEPQPAAPAPEEPKRGLFGLGKVFEKALDRTAEKPAAPSFPPRPRATPVAPEASAPLPVRRAPEPAAAPAPLAGAPETVKAPLAPTEPRPATPAPSAKPARAVDDAILSDMAKQLEAAFRQPPQPSRPPVAAPPLPQRPAPAAAETARSEPFAPQPVRPAAEPSPRPATVSSAGPQPAPVRAPAAAPATPFAPRERDASADKVEVSPFSLADIAPDASEIPSLKAEPEVSVPATDSPPEPVSAPSPAPRRPEPAPAPVAAPEPAPAPTSEKATVDPFSVDEIEAEFARLLGRSVEKDAKSS